MATPDFRDGGNPVLINKPDLVKLQFTQQGRLDYTWRNGNAAWGVTEYYNTLFSDKYMLCCASPVLRDVLNCETESDSAQQEGSQRVQSLKLDDSPTAWWEVLRIIHPLDHTVKHNYFAPASPADWTWDRLLPVALLADKYQMDIVTSALKPAFTPGHMPPPPIGNNPKRLSVSTALEHVLLLQRLDCIDGLDMFLEVVADDMDNGDGGPWHERFMEGLPHELKNRLALQEWKVYECDEQGNFVWHRKGTKSRKLC